MVAARQLYASFRHIQPLLYFENGQYRPDGQCVVLPVTSWPLNPLVNNHSVMRWLDCVWNVMAHAQKPDFVFRRNGRVHLNRRGRQFSRILAAEVCASAVVMLDTPCSAVVWEYWLPTPFVSFPFTSPPCVAVCHHIATGLYYYTAGLHPQSALHFAWLLSERVSQTLRSSYLSHYCSYYVSTPLLAPPPRWLQKHTDPRAYDFARPPDL